MSEPLALFQINEGLDRSALAGRFARDHRLQIRDILTEDTAHVIADILERETPWGLASAIGAEKPQVHRAEQLPRVTPQDRAALGAALMQAVGGGDYAFLYGQYPMLQAYQERWHPDSPLEYLLEHINDAPLLALVREVTGVQAIIKADAQATLFAPGHFLSVHDDGQASEGRRIAYVFSFARQWRPDWGGYLLFYDEHDDVIAGFKPRFNSLNLFTVPQRHNVSYVVPGAPAQRFAITGWFRDR